jgi:peptidoglycan/xylan/chitin deacetylase (PgdA/CDA1 family)
MNSITLLYHDVVRAGEFQSSGFTGGGADIYKLDREEFCRHLDVIARVNRRVLLTFDDGGVSFYDEIAPALEDRGRRGYFFIATNWIGKPGFLSAAQIRELRARGHRIGTHSCSHPQRMSRCSFEAMKHEWADSIIALSDVLGERIEMGSVPGGYYSRKVANAAAVAGLRTLFTSEPSVSAYSVDSCVVVGRFTIRRGTSSETTAALAGGAVLPRLKQYASWNTKKLLKLAGGSAWLNFRKRILSNTRREMPQGS